MKDVFLDFVKGSFFGLSFILVVYLVAFIGGNL